MHALMRDSQVVARRLGTLWRIDDSTLAQKLDLTVTYDGRGGGGTGNQRFTFKFLA
jgi:hypothetical protein